MIDLILTEHHDLLPIFHKSLRLLAHTVNKHPLIEVFLHLGDIDNISLGQFLKLLIVDICTVKGNNLPVLEMAGGEHEGVVGSGGGELHVTMYSLVCMNDGMHLYAT